MLLIALCMACADELGGSDASTASADAAGADAAARLDSATAAADATSGPPSSPTLDSVRVVVHGTMALAWTNPAGGCTTVAVNRKKDAGAYALATRLAGVATETNDMPGHDSGTYCYNVVCTVSGVDSAPSNERCVTQ